MFICVYPWFEIARILSFPRAAWERGSSTPHRASGWCPPLRIHGNRTCRRSGIIRCGPEGVCSDRCRQLVIGCVSRLKDGGPSVPGTDDTLSAPGTADILSASGIADIFSFPCAAWEPETGRGAFTTPTSGSHAPAWEQIQTLWRHETLAAGAATTAFPRWSVGTSHAV